MVGIQPANLIPSEPLKQQAYRKTREKLKSWLIIYSLTLMLLTSAILAVFYYLNQNSDQDVPQKIKDDYLAAIKGNENIAKKRALLQQVKKDDCRPLATLSTIITKMPEGAKLTRLDIVGQKVVIEGYSYDSSASNLFVSQLNSSGLLWASAERISANEGVNTFVIKAAKQ